MSTQTFSPEVCIPNLPASPDRQKKFSPTKRPTLRILQPDVTYTGSPIKPLQKGLPKQHRVAVSGMQQGHSGRHFR